MKPEFSNGPEFSQVANYPLECRERFLVLSARCPTASLGVKRHFIYPEIDPILDDYLLWASIYDA